MVFAVVPTDAPGVRLLDDWQMLGMRSTVSCSVTFDDVFVPDDDVVGEPGGWVNNDPRTFSCGYASNHLGTAQGAFDFIAGYVAEPPRPQRVRKRSRCASGGWTPSCSRPAARCTRQRPGSTAATTPTSARPTRSAAMHLAKNAVLDIPYQGFDIVGARAAHERYPLGQMMRDARTFTLHFRDDLYVQRLADMAMGKGFSAKKARSGSTPFDQSARRSVRCTTTPSC